jgi:outer membrane receptor protein involved in Fe transport
MDCCIDPPVAGTLHNRLKSAQVLLSVNISLRIQFPGLKLQFMRKSVITLSFLLLFIYGFGQLPPGMAENAFGRFYGRVIDATTKRGIEAASVQLFAADDTTATDSLVGGMLTRPNGDFSIDNLRMSKRYKLIITGIGFEVYEQLVDFREAAGTEKDLGNIRLSMDPQLLAAVTVTATRPGMSLSIDRKVFNVDKSISSAGGTAEDVMRNVPSLSVDIDGNLTLRNSSPQIFVDGRPTTLTLEQIPADAIESVELITNPSAKFDASGGGAGIVNIVLKKNRKTGYNGSVRAGVDKRLRYNLGGDLNVRQGKINTFASINFRQRKSITEGTTDRLTRFSEPNTQLHQIDDAWNKNENLFGRAGFDIFIDNRNTISFSGFTGKGVSNNQNLNDLFIDTLHATYTGKSFSMRRSNSDGEWRNKGLTGGYKHIFARPGHEWTADVNYNSSSNENYNVIVTQNYQQQGGPLSSQSGRKIQGAGKNDQLIIQTDYVNPVSENSKIEFGGRLQSRKLNSSNIILDPDYDDNYFEVPQLSSRYNNEDRVYAGYTTFTNKIKNFGYQLGLRIESSEYSGTVFTTEKSGKDTVINYSNSFPISLFPSIFLTWQLSEDDEMQLNLSRRINRPSFWQLFPYTDYSDSLNLSRGNPNLTPEFTYSSELAYQKTFDRTNTFLASLYFRYTDKLITRSQQKEENPVTGTENLINTYINANSSYIGGLEMIYRQSIAKWWETTSNLNLFTSRINLNDPTLTDQGNIYSWSGELENTFRLPGNFTIQLSAEYRSKTILPAGGGGGGRGGGGGGWGRPQTTAQGYIRPQWEVDASVRYEFLKERRASVSLSFNDVFRSDANRVYSESAYFVQDTYRLRDPQFIRLNFNYRFGKFDTSLFRRKPRTEGPPSDEGEQF